LPSSAHTPLHSSGHSHWPQANTTSRILLNFTGDRVTQIVLGMFTVMFTYCLIVLRTIRGGDEGGFVPSIAITLGVVLAIGGIVKLIFFIHHIAAPIQASSMIVSVAAETIKTVDQWATF